MRNEAKLLIGALGQAVAKKPLQMPQSIDWQILQNMSRAHGVDALVCQGLKDAGVWEQVPEAVKKYYAAMHLQAIYREAQFEHVHHNLQQALTQANVPHIFLKGACLKKDYPVPALRTMCDLDILVYTKDYDAIDRIAKAQNGTSHPGDGNHRNYSFPGGVAVEFHPNLLHHSTPVGTQINPGWQYAKKDCPTSSMELTEEGFYLNTICHLANHFVRGGVGVRFVLDVWVCRNLRKNQPDRDFVETELKRFGLLEFTQNLEALAENWFGSGENSPLLEELGEYFISSGSHGLSNRAMLNAVAFSSGGTQVSALMGKAFYPKEELEDRFPWCKGKPWLLPAAWCTRAFLAVKNHGHRIVKWGKGTGQVTRQEVDAQRELLARFGIKKA